MSMTALVTLLGIGISTWLIFGDDGMANSFSEKMQFWAAVIAGTVVPLLVGWVIVGDWRIALLGFLVLAPVALIFLSIG